MTDENLHEEVVIEDVETNLDESETDALPADKQYGVGPFTIREIAIVGAWLVAFVVSFFSVYVGVFQSVWTGGIDWVLMIGVPTVAVFLVVLRRFSPDGIRRVGSLGVDQFASVAFSVSAVLWLALIWQSIAASIDGVRWFTSWVIWVEFVLMLALVVLTVFAPFIPTLREDFQGRPEIPAHRSARPVRGVVARPRPVRPPAAEPVAEPYAPADPATAGAYAAGGYTADQYTADPYAQTGAYTSAAADAAPEQSNDYNTGAPFGAYETGAQPTAEGSEWAPSYARTGYDATDAPAAESAPAPEPTPAAAPVQQPFWALVPVERDVLDEQSGAPLFRIGPTAWALVIADRGSSFLVRHDDGRVGVLYDVSGVTRG